MKLRLDSVMGNSQRLDGGSMFGNAPKAMWQQWAPPDEHNRIALACRSLLVRDGQRTILFEAGIGAFFSPEMRTRFGVQEGEHVLLQNLAALGVAPSDIDVVVLSHLHFDHAGGVLETYREGVEPGLVFERAHYVVGEDALRRARRPHARDRASFIPELPDLLTATNRLERVQGDRSEVLGDAYRFHRSDGHTPGMLLVEFATEDGPLVFSADLVPGVAWVRRAITMGYDRYPELLIDEKSALLEDLERRSGRLFFTHDPSVAACRLGRNERGHVVARDATSTLVR